MIKELSGIQTGNWIVKYVYFMFIKLDYYILDAPVSNRLIIWQGVSECHNFSIVVKHKCHLQTSRRTVTCSLLFFLHGITDTRLIATKKGGTFRQNILIQIINFVNGEILRIDKDRCKENWLMENWKRDKHCSLSAEWRKMLFGEKKCYLLNFLKILFCIYIKI